MTEPLEPPGHVVELFAGVGGFRLGLEGLPDDPERGERWQVVWSNQWEPSTKTQHATACYVHQFGDDGHVCADIEKVLDWAIDGDADAIDEHAQVPVPDEVSLLCGGFPCQDYSVAKPLPQADGIVGQKGVLWWQIARFVEWRRPRYVLLENVDRLLNSPSSQRGRDFAVMLSCLTLFGYTTQWRVINAADYGFPQRRRRVFILAERDVTVDLDRDEAERVLLHDGTLAEAFPVSADADGWESTELGDPYEVSEAFGHGAKTSMWGKAGVASGGHVWTADVEADWDGPRSTLGDVLLDDAQVPEEFFVADEKVGDWEYLKGPKDEERVSKSGHRYTYSEGGMAFPEPLDRPSRTILTGEGGRSPSRFKHAVRADSGRLRRLTPVELERLQGFPDDWTAKGADGRTISDGRRAFLMGNALVVGVVDRIGRALADAATDGRPTTG